MVAAAWAGVEVTEVEGVGMPALVLLAVAVLISVGDTGSQCGRAALGTSFSDRKSLSFKFKIFTPVAAISGTVGMPSRTVTRTRREGS